MLFAFALRGGCDLCNRTVSYGLLFACDLVFINLEQFAYLKP